MLWVLILSCTLHKRRNVHLDEQVISRKVCLESNNTRIKHNRSKLIIDKRLNTTAQKYAEVLKKGNFFSHMNHETLSERTPLDRVLQSDGVYATTAENLSKISILQIPIENTRLRVVSHKKSQYTQLEETTLIPHHTNQTAAKSTVQGWMDSKVHRENLLFSSMTHMGCGTSIIFPINKVPMLIAVQLLQSQ